MLSTDLALTTLERLDNFMMDFLIPYMLYIQSFNTLWPPHGLEEAHVVHRPGPDQFRPKPRISAPELGQGQSPREGFGSISLKTWEP